MTLNLSATASDWTNHLIGDRFQHCISMLYLHGLLSEGERNKVLARLNNLIEKQHDRTRDTVENV